jgi:nucleoid-associated protein YgaU
MPPHPGPDGPIDFSDVTGGATTSGEPRIYVVQKGDSLSKIAKEMYNDVKQWKKIFEANKTQIKNPDMIKVGQKLIIPE